jgi:3-oxoacyl-[acyl-carrier protein] reductase
MDLQLTDKKVMVTGASRGIGKAITATFLAEGARLSICARNRQDLDKALQEFSADENSIFTSAVDVADKAALQNWVKHSADNLGGIDILVLNVSAMASGSGEENWRRSFEVDILSSVNTVECCLPHLEQSSSAAVVFIASTAALESAVDVMAMENVGPYGVFKAALLNYSASLSTVLAPKGIRVNSVSPGPIEFDEGIWGGIKNKNPHLYQSMRDRCRIGRMGQPQDVANAAVFLCSPVTGFITGTNLVVDGAATRRVQY